MIPAILITARLISVRLISVRLIPASLISAIWLIIEVESPVLAIICYQQNEKMSDFGYMIRLIRVVTR